MVEPLVDLKEASQTFDDRTDAEMLEISDAERLKKQNSYTYWV